MAVDFAPLISEVAERLEALRPAFEAGPDELADPAAMAALMVAALPLPSAASAAVGPVYRSGQVQQLLGVSRQAVHDRTRHHRLLALRTTDHMTVYPARQFARGRVLAGVPEMMAVFATAIDTGDVDAWTVAAWANSTKPALHDLSVWDWLATYADHEPVLGLAGAAVARWTA